MLKISKDLFDLLYPVGTYYETSNANWTPSSAGWYGTWKEDSGGKTTVAKDSGTFKTLGASIGSENKTTNNTTLTIDQIPSHSHKTPYTLRYENTSSWWIGGTGGTTIAVDDKNTENTGGGKPHNHGNINVIQPSVVVRRWHRTA